MTERLYSADFERFVVRHFGARGRVWLDQLPARVERYARLWQFELEHHLAGGLGGPWTPAQPEIAALTLWSGKPAPSLLRSDAVGGALLIERIEPGLMFEGGAAAADAGRLADLLRELHAPSPTSTLAEEFPSLAEVVEKLITTADEEAEARSHTEAVALRPTLERGCRTVEAPLDSCDGRATVLHGDLENKNILICRKRGLAAIDPLPCIGDPAYDAGYWAASTPPDEAREQRCMLLAEALDLDSKRVRLWAFVAVLDPAF